MSNRKRFGLILLATSAMCFMFIRAPASYGLTKETILNGNALYHPLAAAPLPTLKSLPDLTVKEIDVTSDSRIKVVLSNLGDAPSTRCILNIKVFKGILSQVLYSTRLNVPAIPPHQDKTLFFNTKGRAVEGNSIKAIVDATRVVEESDEENNEENLTTAP